MSESTTKQGRRVPKSAWKKGQTGNPGGRPAKTEEERHAEALARQHAPEAISALLDIAKHGKQEAARVKACEAILDRGFGRPRESVDITTLDKTPRNMTDAEIIAALASYGIVLGTKPEDMGEAGDRRVN